MNIINIILAIFIVKQKLFKKNSSPHVRWIKDVYSYTISV